MTVAIILASVLAALLWPAVVANNILLNTSDAWGNSLNTIFTINLTIALWSLLGLALLLTAWQAGLPGWSKAAALLMLPLSCFGACEVTRLLNENEAVQWMIAVQVMGPPLMLAYIAWARVPGLRARCSANLASSIAWGGLLVLALLPMPRLAALPALRQQRAAEAKAAHDEFLARFHALTPRSPVGEWMPFIDPSLGVHDETVRRIRPLAHKQRDLEQMFLAGDGRAFPWLWDLEVLPSPVLCAGARKYIQDQAAALKPSPQKVRYRDIETTVNSYAPTLRWLAKGGCQITAEANLLEATIRSYERAPAEGALILTTLKEVRSQLNQ